MSDELRIAVARLQGWKNVEQVEWTGHICGNSPENGIWTEVPDFPDSMDACMELVEEMGSYTDSLGNVYHNQLTVELCGGEWIAQLYYPSGSPCACSIGKEKTLPEAVCKCYLAWKEGE